MKALVYENAHAIESFGLRLEEVPEPRLRDHDLLVRVLATAVNPGDAKIRALRSAGGGKPVILGWEFCGVVEAAGSLAQGFKIGDRVFGAGDFQRDGSYAELLAVDSRVVAKAPARLSAVEAASLPMSALTAHEALFREEGQLPSGVRSVLITGAAGGIGSVALQLLKAKTQARVIATASRAESRDWCLKMGADLVINHGADPRAELKAAGLSEVDFILSANHTGENLPWLAACLRPYGHLSVLDVSGPLDVSALVLKSASVHLEMVFSKVGHGYELGSQQRILSELSHLVDAGRIHPTSKTVFNGLSAANMKRAHELVESGRSVGKVVMEL